MHDKIKHVLITGVSSGIGFDAVGFLIHKGYHVFGSVRKDEDVARLNQAYPTQFTCLQFDVTKVEEIRKNYEKVVDILNGRKLVGLVNNAGLAQGGPIALLEDEKFRYQMEVNLFAVRNVSNIFLPLLKGDKSRKIPGGKIIMISSVSGIFNTPFNGAYCISKHALESLTDMYRRELMMYNIDVVSIKPGPIQTSIWEKNIRQYPEYDETDYSELSIRSNKLMKAAKEKALPTSEISKMIHKILTKPTKAHIVVIKQRILTTLFIKFIPARWADRILFKQFFS